MLPAKQNHALRAAFCALTAAFALLLSAPAARADYAVLRTGQRLHITGWERLGDSVRLDMAGGSVTVNADELASVEREEVFPASPQAAVKGAAGDTDGSAPYAEQIQAAALAYSVDPQLIASVIAVESNFNPRAISRKAARGLMQLRPETATRLAVRDVFDPKQNIDAGTHYLKELLDRYSQNLTLALAAYNAGPERVEQYRGVPPYPETVDYIRRVTAKFRASKASAHNSLTPLALDAATVSLPAY